MLPAGVAWGQCCCVLLQHSSQLLHQILRPAARELLLVTTLISSSCQGLLSHSSMSPLLLLLHLLQQRQQDSLSAACLALSLQGAFHQRCLLQARALLQPFHHVSLVRPNASHRLWCCCCVCCHLGVDLLRLCMCCLQGAHLILCRCNADSWLLPWWFKHGWCMLLLLLVVVLECKIWFSNSVCCIDRAGPDRLLLTWQQGISVSSCLKRQLAGGSCSRLLWLWPMQHHSSSRGLLQVATQLLWLLQEHLMWQRCSLCRLPVLLHHHAFT